jgi:hypothetical protein
MKSGIHFFVAAFLLLGITPERTLAMGTCLRDATVPQTIYPDGWRSFNAAGDTNQNGWSSDDIAAIFSLPGRIRNIGLGAWASAKLFDESAVEAIAAPLPTCRNLGYCFFSAWDFSAWDFLAWRSTAGAIDSRSTC